MPFEFLQVLLVLKKPQASQQTHSTKAHLVRHWQAIYWSNTLLQTSAQKKKASNQHRWEACRIEFFAVTLQRLHISIFNQFPSSRFKQQLKSFERASQDIFLLPSDINSQVHLLTGATKKGFKATTASRSINSVCMCGLLMCTCGWKWLLVYSVVTAALCLSLPKCNSYIS